MFQSGKVLSFKKQLYGIAKFGYPYNDLVICKGSTDYLSLSQPAAIVGSSNCTRSIDQYALYICSVVYLYCLSVLFICFCVY